MEGQEFLKVGRTFILAIICLGMAFLGSYLNMFPSDVFTNVLYAVMGAYSLKTSAFAVAKAVEKKNAGGSPQ